MSFPIPAANADVIQKLPGSQQAFTVPWYNYLSQFSNFMSGVNWLGGCGTARVSTTTFSVAVGGGRADNDKTVAIPFGTALTKSLSAWVAGNNNGSLDTGAIAASKWYHVFIIFNPTANVGVGQSDVLISLSLTPALPAGYTFYRRVWSILTNASSQITPYSQLGDECMWLTPPVDVNGSVPAITQTLFAVTVPALINVFWRGYVQADITGTTQDNIGVYAPDQGAQGANTWITGGVALDVLTTSTLASTWAEIRTNTSQQIAAASLAASAKLFLTTLGYRDRRGQDN